MPNEENSDSKMNNNITPQNVMEQVKKLNILFESHCELFDIGSRLYYARCGLLVKAGFTREEALQIICARGIT